MKWTWPAIEATTPSKRKIFSPNIAHTPRAADFALFASILELCYALPLVAALDSVGLSSKKKKLVARTSSRMGPGTVGLANSQPHTH